MAKKATRESYGAALVKYGADERIVVLDADLSKSTKTEMFKKEYPDRFFNAGKTDLAEHKELVFITEVGVFND